MRRTLLILLCLILAGGALFWLKRPQPLSVSVSEVSQGTVEATVANTRAGTVEACQRTRLSTITGGRIEFLGVKEGDRVKKGQLLLKLWNDDQQAQARLAESQIALAKSRVDEACLVAANAEREAERQSRLRAQGFVSVGKEDQARTDAEARRAACQTARADVRQAEAKWQATRVEQGRVALYAPFAGTVAKIVGELGEYSTPSPPGVPTPPAIDLIDDSCLYIKAPMDEVDAPRISAGLPVRITLDALKGKTLEGRVRRVAPYVSAVEKQARTVDVEVDFTDPAVARGLLVGYSADIEILLERRAEVLRIPSAALQEGRRVLVLDAASGTLVEKTVKTGLANWEFTEITEGLSAGEAVVTALDTPGVRAGVRAVAAEKR